MHPRRRRPVLLLLLVTVQAKAGYSYKWSECETRVHKIQSGEIVYNGIDNSTIGSFLYSGHITGVSADFPREEYLALTYEGCKEVCGDPIGWYSTETSLGLVANWIFPLAILLSLPFESLHEGKLHKTLIAILNWLGSPQTALTATIFNFRQLRQSHRRASRDANSHQSHLRYAAYFILCSINQFNIDPQALMVLGGGTAPRMLDILVYGLFRPLSDETTPGGSPSPDIELTNQLLVNLAFQLRMLRRRGVIPMLANLGTFLIAFVFAVVLAFAQLGDDSSPFSLSFGLLVTWLPLLVVVTVVDRNPISSERCAELISRWLYNVEAVKEWAASSRNALPPTNPSSQDPLGLQQIRWWTTRPKVDLELKVGDFIGQGRKIQYCGIPHAFLEETEAVDFSAATPDQLDRYATAIGHKVQMGKPLAWYVVAILSLLLVWTAIMSAFVVSFRAPTVGLGCRTLTYLIFGGFSSVSWIIQFRKRPGIFLRTISHLSNTMAIFSLLVVIIFQVSGLASNCFCKASALTSVGGYIDFKGYGFYKQHFNVIPFWTLGAVLGGIVPTIAFVVALFWWLKCRHLWKANERMRDYPLYGARACTEWLQ